MAIRTPNIVYRDYETDGVPSSGEHNPQKAEIRALLNQMQVTGGSLVTTETKADLDAITDKDDFTGGLVLNDPTVTNNGYYIWETSAWTRQRGLPDTAAVLQSVSGTNTITASVGTGVDPAVVSLFILVAAATNTGAVTLNISGSGAQDLLDRNGDALVAGSLVSGRAYLVFDDGSDYRLLNDDDRILPFRGAYAGGTTYELGDLVESGGSIWYSLQDSNTGNTPTEGAYWTEFLPGASVADNTITNAKLTSGHSLALSHTVADRTALKALDTSRYKVVYLQESGREGEFVWDGSDLSTEVSADTQEGIYVAPTSDATGASGAWVRSFSGAINANWVGAIGDGSVGTAGMLTAVTALWNLALAEEKDMYFPAGTYTLGENNFPFRQSGTITSLLDAKNITLYGDGDLTILKTDSVDGADVLQLNGLKNFHVRRIAITSEVSGTTAGSNGISITNGFDNISIIDCAIGPCASLDKTSYIDGGAGISVQSTTAATEWGTLIATNNRTVGCRDGFGFEGILDEALTRKTSITVSDHVSENCYIGYKVANGAAGVALNDDMYSGVSFEGKSINCQHDVVLNRAHGMKVDVEVITTKTAANRRLDPNGTAWIASDTIVDAINCAYAKNSEISVRGDKGGCDYKVQIGGASAGSSGLNGATENCQIFLDIGGTSVTADFNAIDSGGNTIKDSRLVMTSRTASSFPAAVATIATDNDLIVGSSRRLVNSKLAGPVLLAFGADGTTEYGRIDDFSNIVGLQGKYTGTAGAVVAGLFDQAGTFRLGVLNGNGIVVDVLSTSGAIGAYVGKQAVYDSAGTLIGYFPIYA